MITEKKFSRLHKLTILGVIGLLALGVVAVLIARNANGVDAFLGKIIQFVGLGHRENPVAIYDDFLAVGGEEQFFKISSGYGSGDLADFKLRFPTGQVYRLSEIPPDVVSAYVGEPAGYLAKDGDEQYLSAGFNRFLYKGSSLSGITLMYESELKLDFGDGVFRSLPIDYEELFAIVGKPKKWGKSTSPLP